MATYFEYLTIGAHIRTISLSSKSSKGFLKLKTVSSNSSLSSSASAMINITQRALRASWMRSTQHGSSVVRTSFDQQLSSVLSWRRYNPIYRKGLEASMTDLPAGYYRTELNRTVWEVPEKYTDLSPIGTGAYGQVW